MNETFILTNEDSALLLQYGLELQKLSGCSRRSYAFGERIVSEGMPIEFLYIVKSGRAKVCVSAPNGKNAILCFYISNGLMGDVEFFPELPVPVLQSWYWSQWNALPFPSQSTANISPAVPPSITLLPDSLPKNCCSAATASWKVHSILLKTASADIFSQPPMGFIFVM